MSLAGTPVVKAIEGKSVMGRLNDACLFQSDYKEVMEKRKRYRLCGSGTIKKKKIKAEAEAEPE